MLKRSQQERGFTLLETMLVAGIAAAVVALSIQQYQSYKRDSNVQQVLYNVDQLFQAASYYYQANCRNQVNSSTGVPIAGTGALDPSNNPVTPTFIDPNALLAQNYLSQAVNTNPIVYFNATSSLMKSYIVQFNLMTPSQQRLIPLSGGGTANGGTIYVWKIQIAVRMKTAATAKQYLQLLGGNCLSHLVGSIVTPCPAVPVAPGANDDYVVFERLPSLPSTNANSGMNATNATVKQFNQQYTTMPILYLTGTGAGSQNYLCGT